MTACQHPVPSIAYKAYDVVCTVCDTVMVPRIPGVEPDVMWSVACPECEAPRWWACQRGYGVSCRSTHRARWDARAAALGGEP